MELNFKLTYNIPKELIKALNITDDTMRSASISLSSSGQSWSNTNLNLPLSKPFLLRTDSVQGISPKQKPFIFHALRERKPRKISISDMPSASFCKAKNTAYGIISLLLSASPSRMMKNNNSTICMEVNHEFQNKIRAQRKHSRCM